MTLHQLLHVQAGDYLRVAVGSQGLVAFTRTFVLSTCGAETGLIRKSHSFLRRSFSKRWSLIRLCMWYTLLMCCSEAPPTVALRSALRGHAVPVARSRLIDRLTCWWFYVCRQHVNKV